MNIYFRSQESELILLLPFTLSPTCSAVRAVCSLLFCSKALVYEADCDAGYDKIRLALHRG